MQQWEYLVIDEPAHIHSKRQLIELGLSGWELAGFSQNGIAFFKRPKEAAKEPPKLKVAE